MKKKKRKVSALFERDDNPIDSFLVIRRAKLCFNFQFMLYHWMLGVWVLRVVDGLMGC